MFFSETIIFVSIFLTIIFCQESFSAKKFEGSKSSPNHFNAYLLKKKELRVSALGEINYGISPEYQVGIQGLGFLKSAPNIFFKHKMFDFDYGRSIFALSGGASFFKMEPLVISFVKEKSQGQLLYLSLLGSSVRSSFLSFNFGLFFAEGTLKSEGKDQDFSLSTLAGLSGIDIKPFESVSFNASLLFSFLDKVQVENNEMSLASESFVSGVLPVVGSFSAYFKWKKLSFELTSWLFSFKGSLIHKPIFNVFYSFK